MPTAAYAQGNHIAVQHLQAAVIWLNYMHSRVAA